MDIDRGSSREQGSRVFERFTQESKEALTAAQREARELGHNYIGTEHLLLGLGGTVATAMLDELGAPMASLHAAVVDRIGRGTFQAGGSPPFTPRAKKALELSLREALARNDSEIRPEHLLLGLVREGSGVACQVLTDAGVTHDALSAALGPMPTRPARLWRRGPRDVARLEAAAITPGAQTLGLTARRLAGKDPLSTYHYLQALLEEGVAARILEALGVTSDAVAEQYAALGTAGTSDESTVTVEVGGDTFTVTPEQAEELRRRLRGEA